MSRRRGYASRPAQYRGEPGESQYSRDITIPANGQAEFIAPYDSDFWFVNQTTSPVTLQKGGHTALTLAASAVLKDYVTQGDSVVIVGTAGLVISVYDTYDVKPIPVAKDILGVVETQPLATVIEDDDLAPTSLAAASVEAIIKTGATTLALGQRVIYNLSGEPGTVTGAGIFVYIAIKGATSAKYYAVCQVGSSISGYFEVPQAEKLNVVWRNSDATNAHVMSAHWTAMAV